MRIKSIIGIIMIVSGSVIMVVGYEKYANFVCHCTQDNTTGGVAAGLPPYCYDCDAGQPLIGYIMFYSGIVVLAGGFILFVSSLIRKP